MTDPNFFMSFRAKNIYFERGTQSLLLQTSRQIAQPKARDLNSASNSSHRAVSVQFSLNWEMQKNFSSVLVRELNWKKARTGRCFSSVQ